VAEVALLVAVTVAVTTEHRGSIGPFLYQEGVSFSVPVSSYPSVPVMYCISDVMVPVPVSVSITDDEDGGWWVWVWV
jgi:hypothetical protein